MARHSRLIAARMRLSCKYFDANIFSNRSLRILSFTIYYAGDSPLIQKKTKTDEKSADHAEDSGCYAAEWRAL